LSLTTSIVIPSYYRAFEVRNLFESILKNTRKPLEVLVVDDTPCDEIEHLCKDFEKEFSKANAALVYVRNPRERSSAVARNVGVENASGDIILFLDSDLSLYPDYMKKILEVFERDPAVLGVQGWIINYWASRWALRRLFYAKLFSTCHPSKNSCRFGEYPAILDTVSRCEYLFGANMAYRRLYGGRINQLQIT
jgi:cellulose synthase/poly-beta-1,6-N-acetylglucosamine synthase-like glycosyltransferase